jgi:hypothetical protein
MDRLAVAWGCAIAVLTAVVSHAHLEIAMKYSILLFSLLAGLIATTSATASPTEWQQNDASQSAADAFIERKSDTAAYLSEITRTMERVRIGELGSMTEAELAALESARERIFRLLEGRELSTDLDSSQRIAVFNAQELMQAIIRRRPFEQQICKAIVPIGTRVQSYECMSWEQRDLRTRNAREVTQRVQDARKFCPGGICP